MKNVIRVVLVGCVSCACVAQVRVQPSKSVRASEERRLVSEVLPPALSAFVTRYGVDRQLTLREVVTLDRRPIGTVKPNAMAVIDTLRPTSYLRVTGPVTLTESESVASTEGKTEGEEAVTLLVAGTDVTLGDGRNVEFGGEVFSADVVVTGMVLNAGDMAVLVETTAGTTVLDPGGALLVASSRGSGAVAAGFPVGGGVSSCEGCSVTCASGYHACCNNAGFIECASCKCVRFGTSAACDSGGPGSTACSVSETQ